MLRPALTDIPAEELSLWFLLFAQHSGCEIAILRPICGKMQQPRRWL
jgi:hypothetical protein